MSESHVQAIVRVFCARLGWMLFRNNRGAFRDKVGRWVRYGLANDSKKFGDEIKSSDLIGWRTVTITPAMVGTQIAQFVSLEIKDVGWTRPEDEREVAQKKWIDLVNFYGGYAAFISDPSQIPSNQLPYPPQFEVSK
jgi:hypothetical protein